MIICFTLDLPQLMEALKAINTVGWWKTMPQTRPCLPPMTGNGKHTAYQMLMTGGWCKWHWFTHMKQGFLLKLEFECPKKSARLSQIDWSFFIGPQKDAEKGATRMRFFDDFHHINSLVSNVSIYWRGVLLGGSSHLLSRLYPRVRSGNK